MATHGWQLAVVCSVMLVAGGLAAAGEPAAPGPSEKPAATPSSKEPVAVQATGKAGEVLRRFFAEDDASKRSALADEFAGLAPTSTADLRTLLHRSAVFPKTEPGVHIFKTAGDEVVPPVDYIVTVPAGYKADSPEGWPVFIGCHGTGGQARQYLLLLTHLLGPEATKWILVAPQSPYEGGFKFSRMDAEYTLHVLDDVRHRLNVDSNRVVLSGYSKGGYTTWAGAMFLPGEWAAAVPMACFPLTDAGRRGIDMYLANVLPLHVQYHWGDKDILQGQSEGINTFGRAAADRLKQLEATRFEPIEYAGQGHSLDLDVARIRAWITRARREPFPEACRMLFHYLWQGRAFYVRATAVTTTELDFTNLPPLRVAGADEVEPALRALFNKRAYELQVNTHRSNNSVVIRARNVKEIEVELGADMLDFGQPVKILINGRKALEKRLDVDMRELLETARRTYDFERLVAARLKFPVAR